MCLGALTNAEMAVTTIGSIGISRRGSRYSIAEMWNQENVRGMGLSSPRVQIVNVVVKIQDG